MFMDGLLNPTKMITVGQNYYEGDCKYCMMEQGTEQNDDFLCSPCKCSGSCALVHFNCLKKCNQLKVKKNKVEGVSYYNFEKFFCEVCKEEYPKVILRENKKYQLMPIDIPKGDHLIL